MTILMRMIAIVFPLLLAIPASADEMVMLKAGYMSLDARGNFGSSAGGVAGTPIDVDSTVRFGRSNQVTAEAAVQMGDMRAALNYFPLNFSGDGVLASAVQYNGRTFASGDTVHASLKADVFDASLTYYILNMDELPSRLQLGVEAAVKLVHTSARMQDKTTGVTEAVSTTLPIPTLGARGRIAISDLIGLTGRTGYLGYAGNHFLDSEMQIEFSPLPAMGFYAGYRLIDLKVNHSGVLLDNKFSGPFVGGLVRF